jgi:hypothetical protein
LINRFAVAFKTIGAIALVLALIAAPVVRFPAVAVTVTPPSPTEVRAPVPAKLSALTEIEPLAFNVPAPVYAPVATTAMLPAVVVAIELETVTAAPLIVTGPATEMAPPEIVTPDVFPVFPIRKPEGGPLKVRLAVLKVDVKFAPEDSKTTAPVVLTETVGVPLSASPITLIAPDEAVALLRAPRFIVPVQKIPLTPPLIVIGPPLARMSVLPPR